MMTSPSRQDVYKRQGQLVGQDVALPARIPGHGGGQVDGGAEEAREAGGRKALHLIDRQGAVRQDQGLSLIHIFITAGWSAGTASAWGSTGKG